MIPPTDPVPYAVATVSDPRYAPGTAVLLHSLQRHHPAAPVRVYVIQEGLDAATQARLTRAAAPWPVTFVAPDPALRGRIGSVVAAIPDFRPVARRLLGLQVFRLSGHRRVLFLDSDTLCQGDLTPVLEHTALLACAPDQFGYQAPGEERERHQRRFYGRAVAESFNAGMLSVDGSACGETLYAGLLERVRPEEWHGAHTPLTVTVQHLLNLHFESAKTMVSGRYNYLLGAGRAIARHTGVRPQEAALLHFVAVPKPWDPRARAVARRDPFLQPAYRAWEAARSRLPGDTA